MASSDSTQKILGICPRLSFYPPLLNSASPWATNIDDLTVLAKSPFTGAVTTRTSVLAESGFDHQQERHRYVFFDPVNGVTHSNGSRDGPSPSSEWAIAGEDGKVATLNSLGYSPLCLQKYIDIISKLSTDEAISPKTFIISVTGSPEDVKGCYDTIASAQNIRFPLAMEVNLSCPNIPGVPPPAYNRDELVRYLNLLPAHPTIPVGLKTPPYTHDGQFRELMSALKEHAGKVSFLTATNTLGSCLVFNGDMAEALPSQDGLGGMAGPALHPLALGNVRSLRRMLDDAGLSEVDIIGVGGVSDGSGYLRMRKAGASMVALASGLGRFGVDVFKGISKDLNGQWQALG
ncbi:hypothetical protein VHEMI08734 [[Torrubiella] hemipterigena]|uniref:Dihydroorotate dehydrogenase (fumarate) n=1 Tax=[Torrubiella] hemipterigena TaxID=1531966 RepID=A0A0A1TNR3_9HYPO|nr:hypothetical protein VHEMI08734 [[Torrubiella] hemipterigena]